MKRALYGAALTAFVVVTVPFGARGSTPTFETVARAFRDRNGAPVFPYALEGRYEDAHCVTVIVSSRELHRRCSSDGSHLATGRDVATSAQDQDVTGIVGRAGRDELADLRAELAFVTGGWSSGTGTYVTQAPDSAFGVETIVLRATPRGVTPFNVALDAHTMQPRFAVIDPGAGRRNIPILVTATAGRPLRIVNWRVGERSFYTAQAHLRTDIPTVAPLKGSSWRIEGLPASVPIRDESARPYVDVDVGSSKYRFLLDSGTQVSSVDPAAAARMGLQPSMIVVAGAQKLPLGTLPAIGLGGATIRDARVIIARVPFGADGILGAEILMRDPVALDFEHRTLEIGRPVRFANSTALGTIHHIPIAGFTVEGASTGGALETGIGDVAVVNQHLVSSQHVTLKDSTSFQRTDRFGRTTTVPCGFANVSLGGIQPPVRTRVCVGGSAAVDDEITKLGITGLGLKKLAFDAAHNVVSWSR